MAWRNTATEYGSMAKFLHWLVAILVITLLFVGFFMEDLPNGELKGIVYGLHKSTGLLVLTLMIIRITWTLTNPIIRLELLPRWEAIASRITHGCLYILLLAMSLSGWAMSTAAGKIPVFYGLFSLSMPGIPFSKPLAGFFHSTHTYVGWTIAGLVTLHILAALKHHFINHDQVLKRMLPK